MTYTRQELEEMARSVPFWYHSNDLGQGVVTPGLVSHDEQKRQLARLNLPDLRGKTVLDINSWDGFYAFECERRGAARVVALDEYIWATDITNYWQYVNECRAKGQKPLDGRDSPHWNRDELPGRAGFEVTRRALGSRVEVVVGDFMDMDIGSLGTFDVVLFLGSLYHMRHPLLALERLAQVTRGLAVIETQSSDFPGYEGVKACEFYEDNELNSDHTNWWAPNDPALVGMCRAAGFREVEIVAGAPARGKAESLPAKLRSVGGFALRQFGLRPEVKREVVRYRAVAHARK